jgi:hypothetical protein
MLPRVVASSVVRSSHQGESHGGVYLIDFESGSTKQVIDWDDPTISWQGRGEDRGLRGIAFHRGLVYLAASDEIFVYDPSFRLQTSFRNPFLGHTHEIFVEGQTLNATSTGFDSILAYDLERERFTAAHRIRFGIAERVRRKLGGAPMPRLSSFNPEGGPGPAPADTTHVNSVFVRDGTIFASGRSLGHVVEIRDGRMGSFARIPYGSHNARPYRDGVVFNHTGSDRVAYTDRNGRILRSFPIVSYHPERLRHASLGPDQARQAFGRGLAVLEEEGLLIAGSSPATVTLYSFEQAEPLASVNLTMDVRNAIHGLEVWPFE